MVPIDIPPMLQGFAGSSRPKKRRARSGTEGGGVTKRHKPNNHSNRLKCQVEMNEIPWTNNPVQKSPRKVFTFRVGLLTSFKLYKEPWTNCVRSDFLRLIKSNHADHWMPAAGEKNWRFFIQKHDFQQQKLLTNVKKPLKCSPSAKLKTPPNFRNYPKNRLKIPLSKKTS